MLKCILLKFEIVVITIACAAGVCSPVFAGEWEKPWSSVKKAASIRCAEVFPEFQLQAVCMENEKNGYNKMKGNFGMPNAIAIKAKERCEEVFKEFQLQAVCMENEEEGYEKMKNY